MRYCLPCDSARKYSSLLSVSAIPTLIAGTIGYLSLVNLGEQLASETSQVLLNDAEIRMQELAFENGKIIGFASKQLEMAVRVQQVAAQRALTSEIDAKTPVYLVDNFDNLNPAPPGLHSLQMFNRVLDDGSTIECPVSYETQAIIYPIDADPLVVQLQARQLISMNSTYRALSIVPGTPALHYFTATVDGVLGSFPGHGGMPEGYDASVREWFLLGAQSDGRVVHTKASVDASTNRIVSGTVAPIFDEDGVLLGVTGAERSVVDVLHAIHIPKDWRNDAVIRVVFPEDGKLIVIASQDMVDGALAWNATPEVEVLFDASSEFTELISSISDLKSGCIDLHNKGVDMMAAYAPIDGMDAALVILVPHDIIAAEAIAEEKIVNKETLEHASFISNVALAIILVVILLAFFVSKRVSKPIVELATATASITNGDFDISVEYRGGDEIGELTNNFNAMVPHLKERIILQKSLEVAKQIQQCLLPGNDPVFEGWEITGKSLYCDATGGDYYDFIAPPSGTSHLRLALGDVTGHGIASALMMATARSLLRGGMQCGDNPVTRLGDVNNALVHDTPLGWFMTFFCLELEANSGEVHWVSAGHDPAIVVDLEGNIHELEGDDIPLGVTLDWSFTDKGPATIEKGSVILMGTDGIWEARNTAGDMFDKPRMIEILINNRIKPVHEICNAICDAVLEFCGDAPRSDDITMVVARRN